MNTCRCCGANANYVLTNYWQCTNRSCKHYDPPGGKRTAPQPSAGGGGDVWYVMWCPRHPVPNVCFTSNQALAKATQWVAAHPGHGWRVRRLTKKPGTHRFHTEQDGYWAGAELYWIDFAEKEKLEYLD